MKKIVCPVANWSCPYYKEDGTCSMTDEGSNPIEECDDCFAYYYETDSYNNTLA